MWVSQVFCVGLMIINDAPMTINASCVTVTGAFMSSNDAFRLLFTCSEESQLFSCLSLQFCLPHFRVWAHNELKRDTDDTLCTDPFIPRFINTPPPTHTHIAVSSYILSCVKVLQAFILKHLNQYFSKWQHTAWHCSIIWGFCPVLFPGVNSTGGSRYDTVVYTVNVWSWLLTLFFVLKSLLLSATECSFVCERPLIVMSLNHYSVWTERITFVSYHFNGSAGSLWTKVHCQAGIICSVSVQTGFKKQRFTTTYWNLISSLIKVFLRFKSKLLLRVIFNFLFFAISITVFFPTNQSSGEGFLLFSGVLKFLPRWPWIFTPAGCGWGIMAFPSLPRLAPDIPSCFPTCKASLHWPLSRTFTKPKALKTQSQAHFLSHLQYNPRRKLQLLREGCG